ncbi:cation-transporting ATPase [Microbacterium trichothecenolyticum]|uniref:Cation-transporting ATPase n=1 Tax=Microbacterium trichothecenolyticum TaxID=69370 RepID=A0ABU0TSQ5_MICTR|nr:cation-transporting ATPase [Microbacterium trichothecenolyticum]MDQ1121999.1 hypothetical protein [Microbacterium trichothecenolyticum]
MVSFSRLFDMASKAVDKASSSAGSSSRTGAAGGRDWRQVVRTAADAVTGDRRSDAPSASRATSHPTGAAAARFVPPVSTGASAPLSRDDRAAIARYDYLLRTADPDRIEQMHREAFARLTPEQRAHVRARMDADLPPHERSRTDAADDLARTVARAEATQPGRLSRMLARAGRGGMIGAGVAGAGGLLAAVAGGVVVSAAAGPLLAQAVSLGVDFEALATGVDLDALASGVPLEALASGADVDGWVGGAHDAVSGLGEQVSGFGERLSNLDIPGFGDFLAR